MAEVIQKRLSIYDLFGYHPTEFQAEFHRFRRRQPYTTLVAHRRFGKTEANLIELLEGCLTCPKRLPNGPCGGVKPTGECEIAPGECIHSKILRLSCWDESMQTLEDNILNSGRNESFH